MALFEINLIRGQVMDKRFRKGLFWGMFAYLILCCVGLSFVVHRAAVRLVDANEQRREVKLIERQFFADYPDASSMLSNVRSMRKQLELDAKLLTDVDAILRKRVDVARVLLGLAQPLPDDVVLVNMDIGQKEGGIHFSVMTPSDLSSRLMASEIIKLWAKDGTLDSELKDIRSETTQREYRSGRPVRVHRFSASLVNRGGGA
jgi:hypothetical protein